MVGNLERKVGDVLKCQDIAVSIARALQVTVEAASISASGAINPAAHDFYSSRIARVR